MEKGLFNDVVLWPCCGLHLEEYSIISARYYPMRGIVSYLSSMSRCVSYVLCFIVLTVEAFEHGQHLAKSKTVMHGKKICCVRYIFKCTLK